MKVPHHLDVIVVVFAKMKKMLSSYVRLTQMKHVKQF
jgi:hypothetical protein